MSDIYFLPIFIKNVIFNSDINRIKTRAPTAVLTGSRPLGMLGNPGSAGEGPKTEPESEVRPRRGGRRGSGEGKGSKADIGAYMWWRQSSVRTAVHQC